jgi:hypothetical protein
MRAEKATFGLIVGGKYQHHALAEECLDLIRDNFLSRQPPFPSLRKVAVVFATWALH